MTGQETIAEIRAVASNFENKIPNIRALADQAIAEGHSIETFRTCLMAHMPGFKPVSQPSLQLSEKDVRRYSIARAILSAAENNGKVQGFEREVSDQMEKAIGKRPEGFFVPNEVFAMRADNIVATPTMGGMLKATNLLAGEFIEILRNKSQVMALGARALPGLVGDINIPRQQGAATGYWATEIEATTQSNTNFQLVTLTPKCITTFEIYSKKLLAQSTPSIDGLIRDDMINVLALAIDLACLHNQSGGPTSISGTTGIATVACGTNGAIPTWANIVALESQVAAGNADVGTMGYLTNALVRGALKTVAKNSTLTAGFVWENQATGVQANGMVPGMMNGYRAMVSNQVAGNLTKGTNTTIASAIFFGNWNDLLIGQWGGTDIVLDPYTAAATREVKIYAHNYVDVAVRHPASFSVIIDALTS